MDCGISTACFYPMETRQALAQLQRAGVKTVEIFLNSFCELEPDYLKALYAQLCETPVRVAALHPFTSGMEPFLFASLYEARLDDGIAFYKKYFSACRALEIPLLVFHGDYLQTPFSFAQHCANFAHLREVGRSYGVELCQENVSRCKCGQPKYLRRMRALLEDDISFVLDVKQMRRVGASQQEMLDAMGPNIRHLHLSDQTAHTDSGVPGQGSFDFNALFAALQAQGQSPTGVLELYRGDFTDLAALQTAAAFLRGLPGGQ